MATARQQTSRRSSSAKTRPAHPPGEHRSHKLRSRRPPDERSSPQARTRRPAAEYSSPACYLHELEESGHPANREPDIDIRRIYDAPARKGSFRVLIDRLWPRGIKKDKAALDAWVRELAPTPQLRKWFGHDPERFTEFQKRYRTELRQHPDELKALRQRARQQPVVLLYGARDPRVNHAVVLKDVLLKDA